jgi:hypothetical protein
MNGHGFTNPLRRVLADPTTGVHGRRPAQPGSPPKKGKCRRQGWSAQQKQFNDFEMRIPSKIAHFAMANTHFRLIRYGVEWLFHPANCDIRNSYRRFFSPHHKVDGLLFTVRRLRLSLLLARFLGLEHEVFCTAAGLGADSRRFSRCRVRYDVHAALEGTRHEFREQLFGDGLAPSATWFGEPVECKLSFENVHALRAGRNHRRQGHS